MALLALSHTAVEHRLYLAMFQEVSRVGNSIGVFGIRRLLGMTGLRSYSSIRRGCFGLVNKLSIEAIGGAEQKSLYRVYAPAEVFERRNAVGLSSYPPELLPYKDNQAFSQAIEHIVGRPDLSRREAFVILYCAEGLSNAEIGERLKIGEQTVKFHLRQIFDKFGVRRRTELVSRLLAQTIGARRESYVED